MTPAEHHTTVSTRGTDYIIVCDVCGKVGQPQTFRVDAETIAARHQEIGGYER